MEEEQYLSYKPQLIKWSPHKTRTTTAERKITKLLKRNKSFYIDCDKEIFFIDSGRWVHTQKAQRENENGKYTYSIGHANNFFPFMKGPQPIKWDSWKEQKEITNTKNIKRKK